MCGIEVQPTKGFRLEDTPATMVASGKPGCWRVKWEGVLQCGHIWTCPVCSAKLRAERTQRIDRALRVAGGRWQMVTFTVSHRLGMPLKFLLDGLAKALRRVKQGGKLQRVWKGRMTASVRAFEVTYGQNGWHPHVHLLIRSSHWPAHQRKMLRDRWKRAVLEHLGPDCLPSDQRGVKWSDPFDASIADERKRARYLSKLGAEIVGVAKDAKAGSWSSWDIARAAGDGSPMAIALWREFSEATRGKRMLEMDDRAARFADSWGPGCEGFEPEKELDAPGDCVRRVTLWSSELRALARLERREPSLFARIIADVQTCDDPSATVREWLSRAYACHGVDAR
ncbi:MAG TPA: protein rep [Polyangiaceae bacterium]|nr:protein rep [Polyangiaceae bacterium]